MSIRKVVRWLVATGLTVVAALAAIFTVRWLQSALGLPPLIVENRRGSFSLTEVVLLIPVFTIYFSALPKILRVSFSEFIDMWSGK